jgi:colanic acid/amylovoran biosynthesis glycosyltransferase
MRVAFFVHSFPTLSETFIARQIEGLSGRGHDVTVFAHGVANGDETRVGGGGGGSVRYLPSTSATGAGWRRSLGRVQAALRVIALYPAAARRALLTQRPANLGDATIRLQRMQGWIHTDAPDIVHCHYGDLGLAYGFLGRFWSAPLVVSFYGYDCTSLPRAMGEAMYQPLFEIADSVIVLSESMRERLHSLGCPPDLLHLHRLSVDTSRFPFRERSGTFGGTVRLLTVARLVEKKGIEYALGAVAAARVAHPDLEYHIIGDGPLRPQLERLTEELGITGAVRFLGPLDEAGVAAAMAEADLFVLPSVKAADGDEEGTPTVLIEASSCGLPILSTHHSGIPEVVLDGVSGVLVPERDTAALAAGLHELLDSPGRWGAMGAAGRKHVGAQFDTRVVCAGLEAHYSALLEARAAGVPADGSVRA